MFCWQVPLAAEPDRRGVSGQRGLPAGPGCPRLLRPRRHRLRHIWGLGRQFTTVKLDNMIEKLM